MDIFEAIKGRRSIRRFRQEELSSEILLELVEAGRCAPSGANRQPLEFVIIASEDIKAKLFAQLAWAGYVQPRRDPPADKRPVAYIIVLVNKERVLANLGPVDAAAAIENILLAWLDKEGQNKGNPRNTRHIRHRFCYCTGLSGRTASYGGLQRRVHRVLS